MTTQEEFRAANTRRSSPTRPLNASMSSLALYSQGLMAEAGEVGDEIKKVLWHEKPLNADTIHKILSECGDVLWYMDRLLYWLSNASGASDEYTFTTVMAINKAKLDERYPISFDAAPKRYGWDDQEGWGANK